MGTRIACLAAQLVEVLFHFGHLHLIKELDADDRHTGTAIRIQLLNVGQCTQLILHHLHSLQLHFMCCGAGIDQYHRGLLDGYSGVFQFGHIDVTDYAHAEDSHNKTPEYNRSLDEKFC